MKRGILFVLLGMAGLLLYLGGYIHGQNAAVKPRLKADIVLGLRAFSAAEAEDHDFVKGMIAAQILGKSKSLHSVIQCPLNILLIPANAANDDVFAETLDKISAMEARLSEAASTVNAWDASRSRNGITR